MNNLFSISDALQQAITDLIQTWVQNHPLSSWFLQHPLLTLGLVVVGLVLLRGLLGAIGRLTERVWLAVLRFPVRLATWLFTTTTRWFIRPEVALPSAAQPTPSERLLVILARLEAMQQEQDTLLKEVRELIDDQGVPGTGKSG